MPVIECDPAAARARLEREGVELTDVTAPPPTQ